jgi:glutamate synthase (NADPH/NADH) large chain
MVAEECREIMARLGLRTIDEMVGRCDLLEIDDAVEHWKTAGIDLTPILTPAEKPHPGVEVHCTIDQNHGIDAVLDNQLIKECGPAIERGESVRVEMDIENIDRAFGAMLSHNVSKRWGAEGLPDDTIHVKCRGSAGQSLAAWVTRGITIEVEGDANDYTGKGLCGGRLIVYPPVGSTFRSEENIIIGNVALYGSTGGEAYFRGCAAERFCVRNSGAKAVIEGVGDHGCEYMTGGIAVILGSTGRNFAAGMSGGVAYIYDPDRQFRPNCNRETIELEDLEGQDRVELRRLIENHRKFTKSEVASRILDDWSVAAADFVKVMPVDYKRALRELAEEEIRARPPQEAELVMSAGGGG